MLAFLRAGIGRGFLRRKPIGWRKRDSPSVAGNFEFESDLKKLADGARALDPCDAAANGARGLIGFSVRHIERNPHIFQDVVLRLIAAAVAIDDESGSTFGEGTAERVNAGDRERDRLHDARAAAFPQIFVLV